MKYQIMHRALKGCMYIFTLNKTTVYTQERCKIYHIYVCFSGLSHVRHLSTVRKHLSSLVQPATIDDDDVTMKGLTREKWSELYLDGKVTSTCSQ